MTLVSSGTLYLVGSSAAPTRSISYEVYGNYTGPKGLVASSVAASKSAPHSMIEFYGYSACSDPTPGSISSVTGQYNGPQSQCTYTTSSNADSYRVQYAISPYTNWTPSTSGGAYDLASPYYTLLYTGSWKFRVCGENCSGLGSYTTSLAFNNP